MRILRPIPYLSAFLLLVNCACGPGQKERATVKGKVTFLKKPLTAGTITFNTSDNRTGSATIDPDGNYVMKDAPLGEVTITVSTPTMPVEMKMKMKKSELPAEATGGGMKPPYMPDQVISIPEKYAKAETSGKTYKVVKGEQTHDVDLE